MLLAVFLFLVLLEAIQRSEEEKHYFKKSQIKMRKNLLFAVQTNLKLNFFRSKLLKIQNKKLHNISPLK
jgi:hypothetical protein